jgi:hypothetical protein
MIEDNVDWLAREVRDLLDASSVGLYEFLWLLRSRHPSIPATESREVAEQALRQLLSDGAGKLILLTWPEHDPEGEIDLDALRISDWDDPRQTRPYVALART